MGITSDNREENSIDNRTDNRPGRFLPLLLVGFILVILIVSLVFVTKGRKGESNGTTAYIYQNNVLLETIDLTKVRETYQFTVVAENGTDYNVVEIKVEGDRVAVGIVEASCPDGLCKNMGFISSNLMPITCLPNHLVIQISGQDAESELDGVAR